MKKRIRIVSIFIGVVLVVSIGGGFYLTDYALTPNQSERCSALSYKYMKDNYPYVGEWMDSLYRIQLWVVPGATHAETYRENKEEYTKRVKTFVESYV